MRAQRVALVTAGGSGMGAGPARKLAADGFKVAILSSSGKGEQLAEQLGGVGITGSNQSTADLARLVDLAESTWGGIDVLVNSAGHGPRAPILALTDEDWHNAMDVYLMNVIRATRLVTPVMQRQRSGAIINISTTWAFEPISKIFSDTYAAENIRMNNILPGWIDSLPEAEGRREASPWSDTARPRRLRRPLRF